MTQFEKYQSETVEDGIVSKLFFFEQSFDTDAVVQFSKETKSWSLVFSVIYMVLIYAGRRYMKHRPAFDLRLPLIVWNLSLAAFSIVGAIRTLPEFVDSLTHHGWSYSICHPRYFYGSTGFWAYAFTASKILELGDTAFIVLRKQQLIFLHWYHHVTVLIYCFYSYSELVASGRWYMVMNYCIHSIMYGYFSLRALRVRMPQLVRITVTSLQIVQMMMGLTVVVGAYFIKVGGFECHQSYSNMVITVGMYVSYLLLFLNFFYHEYTAPRNSSKAKNK